MAWLERSRGEGLAVLPVQDDEEGPHGHAIIVGYGRVGSVVGKGLKDQGLPVVVVDLDRRHVEELRERGVAAVYGDASTPGVLEAARADRARLIVIATPEGFQTRRTIELARQLNPAIDIAVRTQSEAEVAYLERQGIGLAIMGVRELAFGLLDYALRSLGTSEDKAKLLVQNLRFLGEGGAFERRPEEPSRGVPELRQHRELEDDQRSDAL